MPKKMNGTLKFLKENWFLITVASSLIASGTTLNNKTNNNQETIAKFVEAFENRGLELIEYKIEIREVKKDILHLADLMNRNEQTQKEILRRISDGS